MLERRAPIGRWVKKSDIEYPLEHGEVINYFLDGLSIHPVTTKIQILSCQKIRKLLRDFTMRLMVTLKQSQSLTAVIREN